MLTAHFRSRGRHGTVCKSKVPQGTVKGLSLAFHRGQQLWVKFT